MTGTADQKLRRGRKVDQVLEGARRIFLRDGFERASVDDIAREAGVSKATIYAYFPDKALLFLEVMREECQRQTAAAEALVSADLPVRRFLTLAAERILAFQLSDFGQRMFRIVVGEGARFPGLGRQFHDFGPGLVCQRLGQHLRAYVASGQLQIEDVELAADQFAQLCKATVTERLILGIAEPMTADRAERIAKGAVEMFLARYGVTH